MFEYLDDLIAAKKPVDPCPYCGGLDHQRHIDPEKRLVHWECVNCHFVTPLYAFSYWWGTADIKPPEQVTWRYPWVSEAVIAFHRRVLTSLGLKP